LRQILEVQLNDRRSAWDMQSDGGYVQRMPGEGDDPRGSQQILIELAEKRQKGSATPQETQTQGHRPAGVDLSRLHTSLPPLPEGGDLKILLKSIS
jgi:hypothetical protein